MQKSKRSFTVTNVARGKGGKTVEHGRYLSTSPKGAAKKAFNHECNKNKNKDVCSLKITIRETTKGSKHKTFTYMFNRVVAPVDRKICRTITHRYKVQAVRV